ncbi:MAG: hypothetical protein IPP15_12025 [Saprospiraceae bacterium]|uniref:Uncharacterized protein n=1 Tax=Candidatus Opimibacter skivensis TaxID=2982028 RepID=A0A9D7XT13_9BACT|nr:hypothetical protein [Candidatus Opimibacter skivensis]
MSKIAGMVDESMDLEQLKSAPPQPWEFRSKPLGGDFDRVARWRYRKFSPWLPDFRNDALGIYGKEYSSMIKWNMV